MGIVDNDGDFVLAERRAIVQQKRLQERIIQDLLAPPRHPLVALGVMARQRMASVLSHKQRLQLIWAVGLETEKDLDDNYDCHDDKGADCAEPCCPATQEGDRFAEV